jgi:hypothetical protein
VDLALLVNEEMQHKLRVSFPYGEEVIDSCDLLQDALQVAWSAVLGDNVMEVFR